MGLKEKLTESFFGKAIEKQIQEGVDKKLKEVANLGAYEIDAQGEKWRSITGTNRDFDSMKQERMQEIAFFFYDQNGLAKRICDMIRDFVVGEGMRFQATDDKVQKVLERHWNDSINNWNLKQFNKVLELGLFGEQCYPVFINQEDGFVRLGVLDPSWIEDVIQNPENAEEVIAIKRKMIIQNQDTIEPKFFKIIQEDRNSKSDTFGYRVGETFFFAINKVSTAKRGRSDLLTLLDWIDVYERFLFNRGERAHLINQFIWDVTLEGANDEVIKKFLNDWSSLPKPGSVRAHNEKVAWKELSPKLEANDASQEARTFLNHILGQAGLPPHWFGQGQGITRATALEMGIPVFKRLKSRQLYFKYMIEEIFKFVIDQAIIYKTLPKDVDKSFKTYFPKLVEKDFAQVATSIAASINALVVAIDQGLVSMDTAKMIIRFLFSQMGIELNKEDEEGKIKEDIEKRVTQEFEKIKERRGTLADNVSREKKLSESDSEDN